MERIFWLGLSVLCITICISLDTEAYGNAEGMLEVLPKLELKVPCEILQYV